MNFIGLLYILIANYIIGNGILKLFKINISPFFNFCLCMIVGIPVIGFVPLIVQLCYIPISNFNTFIAIELLCIAIWTPLYKKIKKPKRIIFPKIKIYEIPFLVIFILLMMVSVWRCFYYPPLARDLITGPELIAEFAVQERTLINSVFSIDLTTTNNYFKSPFITGLQIVYKLFVCPFGQVWLSVLSLSFLGIIYTILREKLHPLFAGFILLIFITIPELYAYSYLVLYDYSNMVFFFLGVYFLSIFLDNYSLNNLIFSALMFGVSVFIRTETLIIVSMLFPMLTFYFYKKKLGRKEFLSKSLIFLLIPIVFYLLCMDVFVRLFIPLKFDISNNLNNNLANVSILLDRFKDLITKLIFSNLGVNVYGYFLFFFCAILIIDLVLFRKLRRGAVICLYTIATVYFGMVLLGYLVPLVDLLNTTKRGLFKFLPVMVFYMCNSNSVLWLSSKVEKWELI